MDGTQLDRIARGIALETSRRGLLGGLLGGTLAVLFGTPALAVKRRKRRGRRDGSGGTDGSETETMLPPGTLTGGVWEETLDICHFNAEKGRYEVIAVSTVSVPDYLNQGDTLFIDCCTDAECGVLPCLTPTGCIEGACAYDTVQGAPCALGDGTTGVCDADAVCVGSYTGETATLSEAPAPAPAPDPAG
jgi:hypothetical protein